MFVDEQLFCLLFVVLFVFFLVFWFIYLVVVVAGSEETDAKNRQVEEVADGRFRINAIPKEKTGDMAEF